MLSFIIPAHNEQDLLPRTLESIHDSAKAVGVSYEIVVADDASTDETAQVAAAYGARVVHVDHRQISRTRNSGAAEANGDIFIFVDADTTISPALVRGVVRNINAGAVGGGAEIGFEGAMPLYGKILMRPFAFLYRMMGYAYGCFVYSTRDAFEAVGGFDEELFAGEEIAFSKAMNKRGRFVLLRDPVTTSARKLRTYSFFEALAILLRFIFGGGLRSMKTRDKLDLWYGPRREDKLN